MRRFSAIAALCLPGAVPGALQAAETWQVAAECAALYHGHHAYEVASFDPADVSDGSRVMAQDFETAARRVGARAEDVESARGRGDAWNAAIRAHILGTDPELGRRYEAQQRACDPLIATLPEMAAHR